MTAAERYVLLGLRLGRHVDGLVDAYYGPPELKELVDGEELREAASLATEADELLAEVGPGWLGDQLRGLRTYAGVLAGERIAYLDEVEGCYGVRPERVPEEEFARAHERLDELLPPGDSLAARLEAWRTADAVPVDKIEDVMRPMLGALRERTAALVPLPAVEEFALEIVRDEPWAAFNYFLGGGRSRIAVNVDLPISPAALVHLAVHEGYPGHHTEHAVKEQLLLVEQGHLEESIQLVPTPQALLSEGIAEVGDELLVDDELTAEFVRICAAAGVRYDPEEHRRVKEAREPLAFVTRNVAILVHEDGLSREEAVDYVARWVPAPPHRAEHMVSFVVDPTWRAYVTTYTEGQRLCRAYVGGDLSRFRRLLTEAVRVGELSDAADDGSALSSAP